MEFAGALRQAIQSSGLTLERIRHRLGRRGLTVSVATLSYWQRGRSRPRSRTAIAALEEILQVPSGTLVELLEDPAPNAAPVRGVDVRGGAGRPERGRVRAVFQAQQRGVDRWIAVYHHPQGVLPTTRTVRGCRFGRVRMDEASGLIAAELLFDRALGRGETYLLEYGFGFEETGPPVTEEGRGFRTPQHEYLIEVRFHPAALPARCYRTWRPDAHTALKDSADLRLSSYQSVHFIEFGMAAGYHGIRWEWT